MVSGAAAFNDALRSIRQAMRHVERPRLPHVPNQGQEPPDLAPFPCYWLCLECGRLNAPVGDGPLPSGRPCEACRRPGLTDLRPNGALSVLARIDEEDAPARASRRRRMLTRAIGYGFVAVALGTMALLVYAIIVAHMLDPIYISLWVMCLTPVLLTAGAILQGRLAGTRPKPLPARWSMPPPPKSRPRGRGRHGRPIAAETIHAPLTGRPCVAWEVGARVDADADGVLGSWLLLEQRSAALSIAGAEVPLDGAVLSLPREPLITGAGSGVDDEALATFLRQRGLSRNALLHLYETIVTGDDECVLRTAGKRPILERARRARRAAPVVRATPALAAEGDEVAQLYAPPRCDELA